MKKSKSSSLLKLIISLTFSLFIICTSIAQDADLSQTILLNDSSKLSYCEYGNENGITVFYFHGFPGSHLDVEFFNGDSISNKLNIRLIAVNRPGYSNSDFKENRTLLDWPNEIAELADSLKIDRFSVLGYSGGGPYALACAYELSNRIDKVIVVSGMTQFDAPLAKKGTAMLIPKSPSFLQKIIFKGMNSLLIKNPSKMEKKFIKNLPDADKQVLKDPQNKQAFMNTLKESFRTGYEGSKHDAFIYKNDWGFKLSEVKHKIFIFHGEKDLNVRIESAKYLEDQLPNCTSIYYSDDAHLSLIYHHTEEIFKLFIKK